MTAQEEAGYTQLSEAQKPQEEPIEPDSAPLAVPTIDLEPADDETKQSGSRKSNDESRTPSPPAGSQSVSSLKLQEKDCRFVWWPKELLYWLLSMIFFLGIVATLFAFKNRMIPNWPYGITVNTIVAILVTFESLLLEIPLAAAIAQLRWNWFRHEKPLIDFIRIGEASQGALGSMKLLIRRRGGKLSLSGAALMICILAIAPLLQQVVSYQTIAIEQGNASVSTALRYLGPGGAIPSHPLRKAIFDGLSAPRPLKADESRVCSTGNCTWPPYQSLAMCSSCRNITDRYHLTDPVTRNLWSDIDGPLLTEEAWSNGSHLCAKSPSMIMADFDRPELLHLQRNLIAWQGLIATGGNDSIGPRITPAVETCALYFCVSTFTASEVDGNFEETRIGSSTRSHHTTYQYPHPVGRIGYEEISISNSSEKFQLIDLARDVLKVYLDFHFFGFVRPCRDLTVYSWGTPLEPGKKWDWDLYEANTRNNDFIGVTRNIFEHMGAYGNGTAGPVFENAANKMTEVLRNPFLNPGPLLTVDPVHHGPLSDRIPVWRNITGKAFQTVTVVHIRWGWISLPAAIQLLVLFFIIVVMRDSFRKNMTSWRDGAVQPLFYGPEEAIREGADEKKDSKELYKFAEQVTVRLEKTDNRWRLMRVSAHEEDQ